MKEWGAIIDCLEPYAFGAIAGQFMALEFLKTLVFTCAFLIIGGIGLNICLVNATRLVGHCGCASSLARLVIIGSRSIVIKDVLVRALH